MAEIDIAVVVSWVLPILAILVICKLVNVYFLVWRRKYFAKYIASIMDGYNRLNHDLKAEFFKYVFLMITNSYISYGIN